jgi:hypothetical protein
MQEGQLFFLRFVGFYEKIRLILYPKEFAFKTNPESAL